MKRAVCCSLLYKTRRLKQWAILLFPLCFCGCFDSKAARNQQAGGRGIAAINRYFTPGTSSSQESDGSAASAAEFFAAMPQGISADSDFALEGSSEIALPAFFGNRQSTADNPFRSGTARGTTTAALGRGRASGLGSPRATSILNSSSFSQLFSSVFGQNKSETGIAQSVAEDLPNPFTEARAKREAEAAESKAESAAKTPAKVQDSPKPQSTDAGPPATGAGVPLEEQFLLIGDFDGSGRLTTLAARRSGESSFISQDGERGFSVYVNFAALEQQSAFYVDDIDFDGNPDLLVTSRAALFGGVLLGDGSGGYKLFDRFVTGYEPIIPTAGPFRNGKPEILTVNTRTGELKTFISADRYRPAQTASLSFLPNFLLHLFSPDSTRDFVMAAQTGGAEQILGWGDDNLLQPTSNTLGADPTTLVSSFKSNSLQVYQVGNYASVVLTSPVNSFNVANMRVLPQTFLILGDIYRQGFVDVGVGNLSYFTPKK